MWYLVTFLIIIWAFYHFRNKKRSLNISISSNTNNADWEQEKKRKLESLRKLKKSFKGAEDTEAALNSIENSVNEFIENHSCSLEGIKKVYKNTKLPDDLSKKELAIRKELNKFYKDRANKKSKSFAIYFAFKHAELLILNPKEKWKNFSGLQKLQSNLKSEEYFSSLLILLMEYKKVFKDHDVAKKISKDIDKTFELWNSRNIAQSTYEKNKESYASAMRVSDKHFIIFSIIEYLDRRNKFNPQFRDELVSWCEKDIELYEQFLTEFHEYQLFTIDEQMKFMDNPKLKVQEISKISFNKVKRLKDYNVPRLNSFDVLWSLYEQENNKQKLDWLKSIASHIGYFDENEEDKSDSGKELSEIDIDSLTNTIEVQKSGEKGKLGFVNSKGELCSTEEAFQDYMITNGWNVMRAEVSFWQGMFALCFWEEIFDGMGNPSKGNDIPLDLFRDDNFYLNRQVIIDRKYDFLIQQNLSAYVNQQIKKYKKYWTRLIYNGDQNLIEYFEKDIVQLFLKRIDTEIFGKIVYRIAQNPNQNRAGVSDFIIWTNEILKMVEVKKPREKVRDSQFAWINWMVAEHIPNEIVRVKGV